ncbi:ubiquitin binding protein [Leucogyrophana mollusca]|uniref:Ubiquitin binding protein n=1 Tax=Leucogyrophana mollusca TaxID=85980 RepID=A0ACB8B410_9AGAM|nr:ubiquitin binding protein [Leucogyrophana mollusca]
MSSISSWLWPTSELDEAVDKATSELIPSGSEDVALNLEICDQIRSKSAPAKDAMRALKRRLNHKNPNVQLLALGLTDVCVKNGGDHFLTEVASREFVDNLVSILKIPGLNHLVKTDILKYIQNWSLAFEGKPNLYYVGQVYKTLKSEGYDFPPKDLALANSAMVDTSTAPEWIDSDVCLRCRTAFSFTNRKHHCRNCGQVFDQQCSSKTTPLPHFGITQAVRVCDGCYSKLARKGEKTCVIFACHTPGKSHRHAASMYSPRHSSARDLADAELQRAIQLSLQEVGAAHGHRRPGYVPSQPSPAAWQVSEPPLVDRSTHPDYKSPEEDEDDPDLRAAIEASLREANAPRPSAPVDVQQPEEPSYYYSNSTHSQSYPPTITPTPSVPKLPNYDLEPLESDAILTFSQTVEQVQAQGGRDMSRYPAVNELFDKANGLRPKLALSLDDTGKKEQMLSEMHDKLSQAVKLYDKLLTEQISHPTWSRSTPANRSATSPTNTQQSAQGPIAIKDTNTWGQPYAAPAVASPVYGPSRTDLARYASPQIRNSQPIYALAPPNQPEYQQHHAQYEGAGPSRPYPPEMANGQAQQTWSQQIGDSSQYAQPSQSGLASLPSQQYNGPQASFYQPTSAPPPTQSPQPLSIPSSNTVVHLPPTLPQAPSRLATQPPQPPPATSFLARHNTVAGPERTALSPRPHTNTNLGRSSSVSHPPKHQQHVQAPPPSLPQFPVAPTSAPQTFDMYGPSVPSGIASPPERREELLIDL